MTSIGNENKYNMPTFRYENQILTEEISPVAFRHYSIKPLRHVEITETSYELFCHTS
jgi:hypothetical protein